jgi:hypothetical protein
MHARTRTIAALIVTALPLSGRAQPVSPPPSDAGRRADSLFRAGAFAKAEPAYEALTKSNPAFSIYWYRLGMAAAQLDHNETSAVAFERAAAIDSLPNALYNVAALRSRVGQADIALRALDRAVARGFANLALLSTDDDLKSIRGDERFTALSAKVRKTVMPCESDSNAHRLDFWLGEWEVRTQQGQVAGHSVIESVSGMCAILENWTGAGGGSGKSLNTWNAPRGQWQQFWVGQGGGVTEYREGRFDGKSVVFMAIPDDSTRSRLTFTPLAPDRVRQFAEVSTDRGGTWKPTYDFVYHRVKK